MLGLGGPHPMIIQRHHKEDVIVGSLLGVFTSLVGFLSYWRNPFHATHHTRQVTERPRMLYKENDDEEVGSPGGAHSYELSRLEEGI